MWGISLSRSWYWWERLPIYNHIIITLFPFQFRIIAACFCQDVHSLENSCSQLTEEYERQKTQKICRSGKTKEEDEAMVVGISSNKGKGKKHKYPWGVCWNCGSKDHYKDKCPEPSKSTKDPKKEKVVEPKKLDSTNAVELDSESEAAFLMSFDSDSDEFDVDVCDIGDGDWFDEVVMMDIKEMDWFSEASDIVLVAAVVANLDNCHSTITWAKLYDSGCTEHISPYQDDLTDFSDILLKLFRAANKQSFSATGIGKLTVDLPNHGRMSKLELTDVQYSPEVAYTLMSLVSVGNLDQKGFVVKFGGGKCEITDPDGNIVGEVPKNNRGL